MLMQAFNKINYPFEQDTCLSTFDYLSLVCKCVISLHLHNSSWTHSHSHSMQVNQPFIVFVSLSYSQLSLEFGTDLTMIKTLIIKTANDYPAN